MPNKKLENTVKTFTNRAKPKKEPRVPLTIWELEEAE